MEDRKDLDGCVAWKPVIRIKERGVGKADLVQ
jgi:hypothetical protein